MVIIMKIKFGRRVSVLLTLIILVICLGACDRVKQGDMKDTTDKVGSQQGDMKDTTDKVGSQQGDSLDFDKVQHNTEAILNGKVMQISKTTILVASTDSNEGDSGLYTINKDIAVYAQNDSGNMIKSNQEQLAIGMELEVGYDGAIMETYPAQINGAYIAITNKGDNLIEMYLELLDSVMLKDKGLNDAITTIGLDLTKVGNLTDSEKSAIAYIIGSQYGMDNCKASRNKGNWTYEAGEMWIS